MTLGATTTWTGSCSRSQTIRCIWVAEPSAPPAKKITSAPDSRATAVASSEFPSTGMPECVTSST